MQIEILKGADSTGLLRCTRKDGSVAWQKQQNHSAFFALHDLTHFAVETTLGYRRGFFGLISEGWELEDAAGRGPRGPVLEEAGEVERLVGLFDSERASSALWSVDEFNTFAPRSLTADQIHRVRTLRADLFRRWSEVSPGQSLKLTFEIAETRLP